MHLINYGNIASVQIQTHKEVRHLSQGNSLCPSYAIPHFAMKTEIFSSGLERAAEFIARNKKGNLLLDIVIEFFLATLPWKKFAKFGTEFSVK